MSTRGGDVVVRAAEHDDYAAVMRFSEDVYTGRDYLPAEYHILLHDKRFNCFVITVGGRVVGYQSNFLLNDGVSYVKVGVRVSEDCRGQGLSKILADQSEAMTVKRHPGIKQATWMTLNQSAQRKMLEKDPDIKLQFRVNLGVYNMEFSDFRQMSHDAPRQVPVHRVSQLNLSQSLRILTDPANQKRLFPNRFFNAGHMWLLYSVDDLSIREVAMKYDVSATFTEDGSTCESVAIRSQLPIKDGVHRMDVWTYGSDVTPEVVAAHVLFWLKAPLNVVDVKLLKFLFEFPRHVSEDEVKGHLVEKLGDPIEDASFCNFDGAFIVIKEIRNKEQ